VNKGEIAKNRSQAVLETKITLSETAWTGK
jgi:hypothetical protein